MTVHGTSWSGGQRFNIVGQQALQEFSRFQTMDVEQRSRGEVASNVGNRSLCGHASVDEFVHHTNGEEAEPGVEP